MNFRINYPINRNLNLGFSGKRKNSGKKVLLIDPEGNYKEYENALAATKALNASRSNVHNCLAGARHSVAGYAVCYAEDFLINGDEKQGYDLEKIKHQVQKRHINKALNKPKRDLKNRSVISYTDDLQPKVYKNIKDAADDFYCEKQNITDCADGKSFTCLGMVFFWADELLDENGKIDFEKGKKLAEERLSNKHTYLSTRAKKREPKNNELYKKVVIAYDATTFEHKRLGTIKELCESNPKYNKYSIINSASGKNCTYNGKIYVFEDDITEYDPMGNKIIDIEKGRQIVKERIEIKKNNLSKKAKKETNL